ncbi:MAG TPA: N-acyl homoserine lactonase family protein [Solirubrobacteraceae bacterium]|jgi:glyoxylase-like metal-dependent hydrolase (beta-lactamase superfamily II)|nr:N-acyl homoserine lactonase family protein [Solirubrobacteraceae bacterium]
MSDPIRLYLCDGGSIQLPLRNFKAGQGLDGEEVVTPVSWAILTHPRGNVIIDGGNAEEAADDPVGHIGDIALSSKITMTRDQAVLPTLGRLGIAPESIRWIVQTHLHFDHTGAIAAIERFPNAQVLVTRTEYEFALDPDWVTAPLYCRRDYDKPGVPWVLLEHDEDGYDLFDDRTLRCWRTPGHAVGHMSVEVHLPSGEAFFLVIDAAYTLDHLVEKAISAFVVSVPDTLASVRKVRRLADRAGATVVCGHDPDAWPSFKHAPEYYD